MLNAEVPLSESLSLMRSKLLHVSTSASVRAHRTPAYKLVIGVDSELTFCSAGRHGQLRAVLVPPCVVQSLEVPGLALGIFMEAGGPLAPYRSELACQPVTGARRDALLSLSRHFVGGDGRDEVAFCDEAFRLLGLSQASRPDVRSERCLRLVRAQPDVPLATLAASLRVSAERLRHVIAQQTGMPLSEHRLLHRTMLAMEQVMRGRPLASAAASAGFADQAHLTRTFGRLFGRTPSALPARATLLATWAERGRFE
jgi:AraC-like DNA-binding protein